MAGCAPCALVRAGGVRAAEPACDASLVLEWCGLEVVPVVGGAGARGRLPCVGGVLVVLVVSLVDFCVVVLGRFGSIS